MAESPLNQIELAASDPAEPPVLDASVFRELLATVAGDLDSVVAIYRTFFATAVTLIDSLPHQHCTAQAAALHTLQGSAAMLGATRLAEMAARLQQVAASGGGPALNSPFVELGAELERVRGEALAHALSLGYRSRL